MFAYLPRRDNDPIIFEVDGIQHASFAAKADMIECGRSCNLRGLDDISSD